MPHFFICLCMFEMPRSSAQVSRSSPRLRYTKLMSCQFLTVITTSQDESTRTVRHLCSPANLFIEIISGNPLFWWVGNLTHHFSSAFSFCYLFVMRLRSLAAIRVQKVLRCCRNDRCKYSFKLYVAS